MIRRSQAPKIPQLPAELIDEVMVWLLAGHDLRWEKDIRKDLFHLMLANRQCYLLGLRFLLREISVGGRWIQGDKLANFEKDVLGADKFRFVRKLDSYEPNMIIERGCARHLEEIYICGSYVESHPTRETWDGLLLAAKPNPHALRSLTISFRKIATLEQFVGRRTRPFDLPPGLKNLVLDFELKPQWQPAPVKVLQNLWLNLENHAEQLETVRITDWEFDGSCWDLPRLPSYSKTPRLIGLLKELPGFRLSVFADFQETLPGGTLNLEDIHLNAEGFIDEPATLPLVNDITDLKSLNVRGFMTDELLDFSLPPNLENLSLWSPRCMLRRQDLEAAAETLSARGAALDIIFEHDEDDGEEREEEEQEDFVAEIEFWNARAHPAFGTF